MKKIANRNLILVLAICAFIVILSGCPDWFLPGKDGTPPVVSITGPTEGSSISGTITITAVAEDDIEVFKVVFKIDGFTLEEDRQAPYSVQWDTTGVSLDTHYITAEAFDTSGNSRESRSVEVTVETAGGDGGDTANFSEDFEVYPTGEVGLTGQSLDAPWIAGGLFGGMLSIEDDPAGGNRRRTLFIDDAGALNSVIVMQATFQGITEGSFSFDIYVDGVTFFAFGIGKNVSVDGHSSSILIGLQEKNGNDCDLVYSDTAGSWSASTNVSFDSWHTISGSFDCTLRSWEFNIDGNQVRWNVDFSDASVDIVNSIMFGSFDSAGSTADLYIDNIEFIAEDVDPVPGSGDGGGGDSEVAPAEPDNLTAVAASSTSIDLTWRDNSDNENGFNIWRYQDAYEASDLAIIHSTGAGATSYSDEGLNPGETYYYTVSAFNGAGTSDISNIAEATTTSEVLTITAPGAPEVTALSASSLQITWQDNSDNEVGFSVWRYQDTTTFSDLTIAGTVGENTTSITDNDLNSGELYYYFVEAYINNDIWEWSDPIPGSPFLPAPVTIAVTDGLFSDGVTISWSEVSGASYYAIYRSDSPNGSYDEIGFVAAPTLSTFNTTSPPEGYFLVPDTHYYYKVGTVDALAQVSPLSSYDEGWATSGPIVPEEPTDLSGSFDGSTTVNLEWTDNSTNEAGFIIYRWSGEELPAEVQRVEENISTFSDSSVAVNGEYNYYVKAYTATGESTETNTITVSTYTPPSGLTAISGASQDTITITWDADSTYDSYNLYRAAEEEGPYTFHLNTTSTEYTYSGLSDGIVRYFKVSGILGSYPGSYIETPRSEAAIGTTISNTMPDDFEIQFQYTDFTSPEDNKAVIMGTSGIGTKAKNLSDTTLASFTYSAAEFENLYALCLANELFRSSWSPNTGQTYYENFAITANNATYDVPSKGVLYGEEYTASAAMGDVWYEIVRPATPTGVSASAGTYPGTIDLDWDYVEGAAEYNIYESSEEILNYHLLTTTTSSYADISDVSGTKYYKVKAIDAIGFSSEMSSYDSASATAATYLMTGQIETDSVYTYSSDWYYFYSDGMDMVQWYDKDYTSVYPDGLLFRRYHRNHI
jgi:fibronectin type 3 domain-containing protein